MKKEQPQMVTLRHTPRQRFIGIVALAVLFGCGIMVGMTINGNHGAADPAMDKQCAALSKQIIDMSSKSYISEDGLARLSMLNDAYAKNCAGRTFEVEKQKTQQKNEDTADKKTCEVIEGMLTGWLNDERETNKEAHRNNIDVYNKLVQNGCPENVEKYQALIVREQEIMAALTGNASSENTQTCAEIERLLTEQTWRYSHDEISEDHIERAKVYANISERGCPENRQKYVDLAAKELEIARALQDDKFSDFEREQISDTYKRIQMKQTANEIMNKVQKLADPAIDFIIQAQKIIEE